QGDDLIVNIDSSKEQIHVEVNFGTEQYVEQFDKSADPIQERNNIARWMACSLKEEGKSNSPWGILTGVRPIKFTINLIDEYGDENEVYHELTQNYAVQPEKASELIYIAQSELDLTETLDPKGHSLYINIPFCP